MLLIPSSAYYDYPDTQSAYYSSLLGQEDSDLFFWDINSYNMSALTGWFGIQATEHLEIQLSHVEPFDLMSLDSKSNYFDSINIKEDGNDRILDDDTWFIACRFFLADRFLFSNETQLSGPQLMIDQWLIYLDFLGYRKDTLESSVKLDDINLAWIELWNETQYTFVTINYQYGVVTQYFDTVNNEAVYFHLNPDSDLYEVSSHHFDYKPANELMPGNVQTTFIVDERFTEFAFLPYPLYTGLFTGIITLISRKKRMILVQSQKCLQIQ